jgi:site-specific recombinase
MIRFGQATLRNERSVFVALAQLADKVALAHRDRGDADRNRVELRIDECFTAKPILQPGETTP